MFYNVKYFFQVFQSIEFFDPRRILYDYQVNGIPTTDQRQLKFPVDDKELEFLRRAAGAKNLVGRTLMISGMGILIKDFTL